ncbi:MAG: methyltetrahydrofolate cobalamin methyltransferase, partial [Bacillota bacterium]
LEVLEALRLIKKEFPAVHTICGLSNVSYGLPSRPVLNQAFLIQTMTAGMDSYILDPLDKKLMGFYYASRALLGQDEYCSDYLAAYRAGLYS